MKRYLGLVPLFLCIWTIQSAQSAAQTAIEIGQAVKIVKSVDLYSQSDKEKLKKGSKIRSLETVVTGKQSTGEFRLKDKTMLAVGPKTELLLDKYVYNPNPDLREVVITHLKGGIRFVTGKSPSNTYKIITPNTAIGVRGTRFDVYAGGPIGTVVLLLDGAVNVCQTTSDPNRQCKDLQRAGRFLHAPITGPIKLYQTLPDGLLGDVPFSQAFPFLSGRYCLSRGMSGNQKLRANIRRQHGLKRERAGANICVAKVVPRKPRRIRRAAPRRIERRRIIKKRRVRRYREPVYHPPRRKHRRPRHKRRPRHDNRYIPFIPNIQIFITPGHRKPKRAKPRRPRHPKYRPHQKRYKDGRKYKRPQNQRRKKKKKKKKNPDHLETLE